MAEDDSEKTEDPTGKKLGDARNEGNVPQSQEIKIFAGLAGTLVLVSIISPFMGRDVLRMMLPFIERPHAFAMDRADMGIILSDQVMGLIKVLMFPLMVMLIFGVVSNISQVGLMFVAKKMKPDINKLSIIAGFGRIFSMMNLVNFIKSLLKIGIVGVVIYMFLRARTNDVLGLAAVDLFASMDYLRREVIELIIIVMLMVAALAVADYLYQRWHFMEKMRMTKQEVKDEHKQAEGDPIVKGRLRSLRMQRARQRMMAAVPQASVVVTNPTHYAVALKYDMDSMGAPVLVAKGVDLVAKRIRELADENEVPIVENPPLARALYATVELDQEVPPEHYKAVAEVIGYVMKLKGTLAH
ncbi:flagellar biosynthesis protein FlhB [Magnetospirillum sp. SS-4]|uniref:flagellar biosynthesis protein FlhB n=1 Tax=Magnetospirillum sp. SS-4 TaxID=2681465 RepID=UPI00137F2575|nr:flagellar biosynthesis protein FlhB [Magnetospirillum sp. SS-4]CAA7617502.1 Flagellar biosynthetic protein FlhB [Magnetospirillum sp. SS-4]